MDAVTPAILAALPVLSEPFVKDAYDKLKAVLVAKFRGESDLVDAVEKLEQKPDSAGRRETLREEVVAVGADKDPDVIRAAEVLIEFLKSLPGGHQLVQQTVTGDQNIFSGTGDVTVNEKG